MMDYVGGSSRRSWSMDPIRHRGDGTYPGSGWVITLVSKLCRVWEPSQVQATKRSDVAYIIRILSLESCMCCGGLYDSGDNEKDCMISVYNWTAWFLNQISLPLLFVFLSCIVCFLLRWSPISVGADMVAVSKALLEDEEPSC